MWALLDMSATSAKLAASKRSAFNVAGCCRRSPSEKFTPRTGDLCVTGKSQLRLNLRVLGMIPGSDLDLSDNKLRYPDISRPYIRDARSTRKINSWSKTTMSSDDAYNSFLDQANQDTGASKASTKSSSATTKAVDTEVPAPLQEVEQYYTSETDEPFEPVSLKWSGESMPSERTNCDSIGHRSVLSRARAY